MKPFVFKLPFSQFDFQQLPPDSREPGTEKFISAVSAFFSKQYSVNGETALVGIDQDGITVASLKDGQDPFQVLIEMLREGSIKEALPLLESINRSKPNDIDVLYNLGIGYSEVGEYDEAIIRLKKVVQLNPNHVHAWVGIGVAYQRTRKLALAREALLKAVEIDPSDGYAQRNLGAILAAEGKLDEALPHFKTAYEQLPYDPQAIYGLAKTLESISGPENLKIADELYSKLIQNFPAAEVANLSREARTRIAHQSMRGQTPGGFRPDVMMYIADALKTFNKLGPAKSQEITFEIAMLGQRGLDINNPDKKYTLRSLPGEFSGLQLVSIMYAGFQNIDPTIDSGIDFAKEYEMAKAMKSED